MKFSATSQFFLAVLPKCRLHSKYATKFNTLFKIIDLSVIDVIYPDEMVMTIGLNPTPLVVFSLIKGMITIFIHIKMLRVTLSEILSP